MQSFDYASAQSLGEAAALLARDGKSILVLAGGTDLIVQLREDRRRAALVVDVKAIPELNVLTVDPASGALIGAAVPCYKICQDSEFNAAYPGIVDAVALIGGTQIQGRATVGGNLCNASPAADTIPALIVASRDLPDLWAPGLSRGAGGGFLHRARSHDPDSRRIPGRAAPSPHRTGLRSDLPALYPAQ